MTLGTASPAWPNSSSVSAKGRRFVLVITGKGRCGRKADPIPLAARRAAPSGAAMAVDFLPRCRLPVLQVQLGRI